MYLCYSKNIPLRLYLFHLWGQVRLYAFAGNESMGFDWLGLKSMWSLHNVKKMLTFNFWLFSISAAFPSTGVASVHNLVELFIFSHMSTSSRSDTWLWEIYSFIPSQSNENGDQPPNMIPYFEWLEIVLWLQVLEHCCAVCLVFLLRQICQPRWG